MSRVHIRSARPSDKGPILDFCKNTWPGGDYIPAVWDDWIRDKNGRLLVVADKTVPIGMAHAWFQTTKIAWLEGVRIHPSYRGQGLAGRLNKALTNYAAKKGATTARLCTGSSNLASRRHLDKTGFKLLERFQRLESSRPLRKRPRDVIRIRKYNPRLWQWITKRPEFAHFHQMYSDGWTWYPLNAHGFADLLRHGGVLVTGSKTISSCTLFSLEPRRITLGFTAGVPEEITTHGRYLRALAAKGGGEVRALVPRRTGLSISLRDAGFQKAGTILVYEKHLASHGLQRS